MILPVFNGESAIRNIVNEILGQSYENFELIIINDASTDETKDILAEFNNQNNITVINLVENKGVSNARNIGINNSAGEFICFVDADDSINKDYIKELVQLQENNNLDLVCASIVKNKHSSHKNKSNLIFESEEKIGKSQEKLMLQYTWGKLYKKNIIKNNDIHFPDMELGEDLYFTYQYLNFVNSAGISINAEYFNENINPTSLSKKYIDTKKLEKDLIMQIDLLNAIENDKKKFMDEYYKENVDFKFYQFMIFASNLFKNGSETIKNDRRKILSNFIKTHPDWIEITDSKKMPKSTKDKLIFNIAKTRRINMILGLFFLKEFTKKMSIKIKLWLNK